MKKNPGRVCGRFRTAQMEPSFVKKTLVALATTAMAACTTDAVMPEQLLQPDADFFGEVGYADTTLLETDTAEFDLALLGVVIMEYDSATMDTTRQERE